MKIDFEKLNKTRLRQNDENSYIHVPVSYTSDKGLILQHTYLDNFTSVEKPEEEIEHAVDVNLVVFGEERGEEVKLAQPTNLTTINYKEVWLRFNVKKVLEAGKYSAEISQVLEVDNGVVNIKRVINFEVKIKHGKPQITLLSVKKTKSSLLITANFLIIVATLGLIWMWNDYYNRADIYNTYFDFDKDKLKLLVVFMSGFLGVHSYLIKLKNHFSFDYIMNFFMYPEYVVEPNILNFFRSKRTLIAVSSVFLILFGVAMTMRPINLKRNQLPKDLDLGYYYMHNDTLVKIPDDQHAVYSLFASSQDSITVRFNKARDIVYATLKKRTMERAFDIEYYSYAMNKGAYKDSLDFALFADSVDREVYLDKVNNRRRYVLETKFLSYAQTGILPKGLHLVSKKRLFQKRKLDELELADISLFKEGLKNNQDITFNFTKDLNYEVSNNLFLTKGGKLVDSLFNDFSVNYPESKYDFSKQSFMEFYESDFSANYQRFNTKKVLETHLAMTSILLRYFTDKDLGNNGFNSENVQTFLNNFSTYFKSTSRNPNVEKLQIYIRFLLDVRKVASDEGISTDTIVHKGVVDAIETNIRYNRDKKRELQMKYLIEVIKAGVLDNTSKAYFVSLSEQLEKSRRLYRESQAGILNGTGLKSSEIEIVKSYFFERKEGN